MIGDEINHKNNLPRNDIIMSINEILVFLGFCIPFFLLTIWAVVNAAQKDFDSMEKKIMWVIIASIPFIGFLLYLAVGFRKGKKNN